VPGFANSYFAHHYLGAIAEIRTLNESLHDLYKRAEIDERLISCSELCANDRGVARAFEIFSAARSLDPPFRVFANDNAYLCELLTGVFGHASFPHITASVRQSFGRPQDASHQWRNSDFESIIPALELCHKRLNGEVFIILVGDDIYPKDTPPWVWNYPASSCKSARADVAILGTTNLHFGTNSGINSLPSIFGRPCALHNVFPYGAGSLLSQDLVMYKHVYDETRRRLLTLPEAVLEGFVSPFDMLSFEAGRFRIVNNSSEEILELMDLAIDLLQGKVDHHSFVRSNYLFNEILPIFRYNIGMAASVAPFWLSKSLGDSRKSLARTVSKKDSYFSPTDEELRSGSAKLNRFDRCHTGFFAEA